MLDESGMIKAFSEIIEGVGQGDWVRYRSYLADQMSLVVGDVTVAATADHVIQAVTEARDRGLVGQTLVSAAAHDNVLAVLYRNKLSDGSENCGAAAVMFDDDGKICAIRTLSRTPAVRAPGT
jgi:hypothetical protein